MIVALIVAMDRRRGIGYQNRLPWRLPADLKRFRELTMGHHLIIGRRTWESIGRPLAGRRFIIMTRDHDLSVTGSAIAHSLEEALAIARSAGESEAFIGGGAKVYAQALPVADRIYLTQVDGEFEADTFFPEFDEGNWIEKSSQSFAPDEKNALAYTFKLLERTAKDSA